ncbi:MAG: DUF4382 domain-containing protein [Spirochaetales bacterium]|jgi:hypothetical protein|nr:DUF4382 domain-containing protein [Spirochaetales bacterium]
MKLKKVILSFFIVGTLVLSGCEFFENNGSLTLSLTDAPIENDSVTGVWITVTGIEYHTPDGDWQTFDDYMSTGAINLMALNSGLVEALGTDMPLPAGRYTQIRLLLDNDEQKAGPPSSPGCYLSFDLDGDPLTEDIIEPLFVPSGDTSGYKATGSFTVPINGSVAITADFDLRKAVVETGNHYILKPTIRLIVDGEAGWITGAVVSADIPAGAANIVIYAYVDGAWTDSEALDPVVDTDSRFPNAITSSAVADTDAEHPEDWYKLAFLDGGTYDLAVATYDADGGFIEIWGFYNDAEVIAAKGSAVELSNTTLVLVL